MTTDGLAFVVLTILTILTASVVAGAALWLRMPLGRRGIVLTCLGTLVIQGAYVVMMLEPSAAERWLPVAFAGGVVQTTAIYGFGLAVVVHVVSRGQRHLPATIRAQLALMNTAALLLWAPGALQVLELDTPQYIRLGVSAQVAYGVLLILLLLAIAKLEQLLRRVRDPLRYQLKFVALGLGGLSIVQVYLASVMLLQGLWEPNLIALHSAVTLFSLLLVGVGVWRLRGGVEWTALAESSVGYGSLSFLIVGAYLLAMGIGSALLPRASTPSHYLLGVIVASAATVALSVLLASRYVRTVLYQSFVRTFKNSKHDYRKKWLEVAREFHSTSTVEEMLERLLDVLGRSFRARRMSVWMPSSTDGLYYQRGSINVESPPAPLSVEHPIVERVLHSPEIIHVSSDERRTDAFCRETKSFVVVPLWAASALGFVALSDDVTGSAYDQDDLDLLQVVCSHVGILVAHAQLAEAQRAGEKIRAFHEFSMFCIHDLKNLAGRLSLVAQNAKQFGDNPEFQASALRTVATTVERTTALINKLSTGFDEATRGDETDADLYDVLLAVSESMRQGVNVELPPRPSDSTRVALTKHALTSVLLNVFTNAEQATAGNGGDAAQISVTLSDTSRREWRLSVRDNGPGIAPQVLETLFQPLRSTKRMGFGVGLYQCKRTLQAAGGDITVHSELGKGTSVTVVIPRAVGGTARQLNHLVDAERLGV